MGSRKSQLLLAGVIALGLGGRAWRNRAPHAGAQVSSSLDAHLARVDSARIGALSGRPSDGRRAARAASRLKAADAGTEKGRGRARQRAGAPGSDSGAGAIRHESTPVGALDPAYVARQFAATEKSPPARSGRRREAASPRPSEQPIIDVDRADGDLLESLPGIGPSLAARIIADRARYGPFGSLAQLQRVWGVGPSLARQLEGRVTFGGTPRPSLADSSARKSTRTEGRGGRHRARPP